MSLYDADYFQWTQETTEQLRRREFANIDVAALIEEVEDLGRRERGAVQSRLMQLMAYFLKWDYQPDKRTGSWESSIKLQRNAISRLLKQSPSLRPFLGEIFHETYSDALLLAVRQTGLDEKAFPERCPYHIEEILKGG